ncbi:NAD-dependent epimerase/dehydratase [Mesorhizobium plurifarium]|uniref:NAD-dependent epimerase/dehydratase n=1 Tax=Mesorhizobium plurifarium TaxID=69974 RepID=A0A090FAC9_MESPL|nr:NAD-dependent epimerase/dehydratase [Mesorhizobium plurifarium]
MANRTDRADAIRTRTVTVFGGTGFLGRRIVRHVAEKGFAVRAVSRHPDRGRPGSSSKAIEAVQADILDASSVASAIAGSCAVVNAVSLYVEHGEQTFERVHVEAAAALAAAARDRNVDRLIHISGIGSNPRSHSKYVSARGRGEAAVTSAFSGALIVRPAVMTGPDDAFLTSIVRLIRSLPLYPLFGHGQTRLQPVYVEDVAEAVARLIDGAARKGQPMQEFGGPRLYTYKELVRQIGRQLGMSVVMVPVPFAAWKIGASIAELLSVPPITRNQVELMAEDNFVANGQTGFAEVEIEPRGVEEVIRSIEERS